MSNRDRASVLIPSVPLGGRLPRQNIVVPGVFGWLLPARIAQSTGSVTNVSTKAQLESAIGSVANGSFINITASINGGATTSIWSRAASAAAPITITCDPGVLLTNFSQILLRGSYLRVKGLNIGYATIDGLKIDLSNAHDIEVDGCDVHHSVRQGINIQPPGPYNIQIWNTISHDNGSLDQQDHGVYFNVPGSGNVVANCVFYNNQGYNSQLYSTCSGLYYVNNTVDGGKLHAQQRGGIVCGGESSPINGVKIIGVVVTNAPGSAGLDCYNDADTNMLGADIVGFGNSGGTVSGATGWTLPNILTANPLYVNAAAKDFRLSAGSPAINFIQAARHGYVPPYDILGRPRVTADAGAYAA